VTCFYPFLPILFCPFKAEFAKWGKNEGKREENEGVFEEKSTIPFYIKKNVVSL